MKYRARKLFSMVAIAATLLMHSCVISDDTDYDEVEQEIFDDWMAVNKPELLANYQSNGGYYVDLITAGDTTGTPICEDVCWVEYELTGYDLYGNVSITRDGLVAWQQGTFSTYTHYVPYFRYCDPDPDTEYEPLLECSQLAFTNELTIGDETVLLYNGAEFTLYSPSSITTSSGTSGSGGFAGQYSLSTLPFIGKFKVTNVLSNPYDYEKALVDDFAISNGGLSINPASMDDDDEDDDYEFDDDYTEPDVKYEWTNSVDTISHLYINRSRTPNLNGASFTYTNPYTSTVPDSPYYDGMEALDKKINEIIEELFNEDYDDDGDYVTEDETAKVWYIGRFLDGFIFDTNIAEVKDLIYNTTGSTGTAISYYGSSDEDTYIAAWYYTIPYMKFGQWSTIITTSNYAYGYWGSNTDSSFTDYIYSDYYDAYSYYYSNSYYDEDYYDSYYSTSTSTSGTTEILPYTPLIFEIYIEADDDDDDDDDDDE